MSDPLTEISQEMTERIRTKIEADASTQDPVSWTILRERCEKAQREFEAATRQGGEIPLADLINACCKERDPHGLEPGAPGAKLDQGKMKAHLLQDFARALWAVGEVGTFGAAKYSEGGWQHADNGVDRYHAAFLRHWMKAGYEDLDPDSGLCHLAHAAWNLLATLELSLRESESDREQPVAT